MNYGEAMLLTDLFFGGLLLLLIIFSIYWFSKQIKNNPFSIPVRIINHEKIKRNSKN